MKKHVIFSAIAMLVAGAGCDYVEKPIPPTAQGPSEECDTTFAFTQVQTTRNVLVEEFTGHYCANCPQAAHYLEQLHDTYSDQLVLVAIHPDIGTLTDPQAGNSDGSYATNWLTEEGDRLFDDFGMPGFVPVGMVNRTDDGGGNLYHYHTTWSTYVPTLMGQAPDISIRNTGDYLSTEDVVCGKIEVEFLNAVTGDLYLTTYLVEDSIVDWQKIAAGAEASGSVHPDYPAGDISSYMHRHVLRDIHGHVGIREGDASGTGSILGSLLRNGNFLAGEKFQYVISFNNLDPAWNTDHLYLVTFVHDNTTHEILQVSQVHVHP
jgi:thiol-disulfide isomerase/thioredoxin